MYSKQKFEKNKTLEKKEKRIILKKTLEIPPRHPTHYVESEQPTERSDD